MPKNMNYRRQLLRAIEAFLEGTPVSLARGHSIIQQCSLAIDHAEKKWTLDYILWDSLFRELSDAVFYESEAFLRETREILLGNGAQSITRTVLMDDYRIYFTPDETSWYRQLLELIDFITAIPFAKIHEATGQFWQDRVTWAKMSRRLPEALQAKKAGEAYQQRKAHIEATLAKILAPENIGDEKIYQVVLREVTDLVTGINVSSSAVCFGYPTIGSPYDAYGTPRALAPGINEYALNVSESISWAKRVLEALAGNGGLFISWRLRKALTLGGDVILISSIHPLPEEEKER